MRSEVADKSINQLQSVFFLLIVAAAIMGIVVLLQLFARFYSSVWDRKSGLALYRAVGASKKDLRALIVGEVQTLVGAGFVIGASLGFAAQAALLGVMQEGLAFPYMAPGALLSVLIVVVVAVALEAVSLVSIIVPLRQIERLDPSMAMQQGDID